MSYARSRSSRPSSGCCSSCSGGASSVGALDVVDGQLIVKCPDGSVVGLDGKCPDPPGSGSTISPVIVGLLAFGALLLLGKK